MSKASIELYSALTALGLDAQHATKAAEAVEGLDAATRIEVRIQGVLLAIIMGLILVDIWQDIRLNREVGSLTANVSVLNDRMTSMESQIRALTEAVNRIAPR
jgi:hypothetical protein